MPRDEGEAETLPECDLDAAPLRVDEPVAEEDRVPSDDAVVVALAVCVSEPRDDLDDVALADADFEMEDDAEAVRVMVAVRVLVELPVPVRLTVVVLDWIEVAVEEREVVLERVDVRDWSGDLVARAVRVLLGDGRAELDSRAERVDVRVDVADSVGSAAIFAS